MIKPKLSESNLELRKPRLYQALIDRNSEFIENIKQASRIAQPMLSQISHVFPKYTLHDIDHSVRIIEYIYDLIPDIEKISDLEIAILIYSALLHDIGMCAHEDELEKIKSNSYPNAPYKYSLLLEKYKNSSVDAVQRFIRDIHNKRSREIILRDFKDYMRICSPSGVYFADEVALICEAHSEDHEWLVKNINSNTRQKGVYYFNSFFCALLLRLGDILDIDSNRTPYPLYKLIQPKGKSKEEWEQHFVIENLDKVRENPNGFKEIVLEGSCNDWKQHSKLKKYFTWINNEILKSYSFTQNMDIYYRLNIKHPLNDEIKPTGYNISGYQFNIDFEAITRLLTGEQLYGDKEAGLRELMQNAIDACKVRCEIESRNTNKIRIEPYKPKISIIINESKNEIIIKDNGTGMTKSTIYNYFLNIGKSFYVSDEFLLEDYNYKPISSFGIGFLSCFMLSTTVKIISKHFNDIHEYELDIEVNNPYYCLKEKLNPINSGGTEIILNYQEFMEVFNNIETLTEYLEDNFIIDNYCVSLFIVDTIENGIQEIPIRGKKDLLTYIPNNIDRTIELNSHLVNTHGYLTYAIKKKGYGFGMEELLINLNNPFKAFILRNDDLIPVTKESSCNYNLSEIVSNNKITYFAFPVINKGTYQKYKSLKIIDRIHIYNDILPFTVVFIPKEAKQKFATKIRTYFEFTNIKGADFSNVELISLYDPKSIQIPKNFAYSCYNMILENGHYKSAPANGFMFETGIILEDNDFILYKENSVLDFDDDCKLFSNNVLVVDSPFIESHYSLPMIDIKKLFLNVCDYRVQTNVSRSNFTDESINILINSILKTILLLEIKNKSFPLVTSKLLTTYIEKILSFDALLVR